MLLATSVSAVSAEHSGYFNITSDYVDHGISQSDEDPVLQIEYEYQTEHLYAGVFASGVEIGNELQAFAGYQTERNGIWYSAGISQYIYTDHDFNNNITEFNASAGTDWKGADVAVNFDYAPDYGTHSSGSEIEFFSVDLEYSRHSEKLWDLEFRGAIGYGSYDTDDDHDFVTHWQFGVTKSFGENCTVSVDYHDTDNSEYTATERAVLSATYHF